MPVRRRSLSSWLGAAALAVLPSSGLATAEPPPSGPVGKPPAAPLPPQLPATGPARPAAVDLPPGIVARVRGLDIKKEDFILRLAQRVRPELDDPRSAASTVLKRLIEEAVVRQEAERLRIVITTEDYAKAYNDLDEKVRTRSSGQSSLADVIKGQHMTPEEFRLVLENQLRKDRIAADPSNLGASLPKDEGVRMAQVEVVIGQLMKRAKVVMAPTGAGAGDVVATVNGKPLTLTEFGRALYGGLAESEVRRHLQEVCLTLLLDQEGLDFTAAQVDEALKMDRVLYDRMRLEAISDEKKTLSFDAFLQMRYGAPVAELRDSRYRRGLFALRQRFAKTVTDAEVTDEWKKSAATMYGPSLVVTDVQISYTIPKAVIETTKRRTRDEALRLANDFVRRGRAGEPAGAILKEVQEAKVAGIVADRRVLFDVGNDLLVFEAVRGIADAAWSEPLEGMAEFHVVYREALRPAPTFAEIAGVVRQNLVDRRSQLWLQDALTKEVLFAR